MIPDKSTIEKIINELKKILKIQDLEIYYRPSSSAEMLLHTGDKDNLGYFSYNIRRNQADVYLNTEDSINEKEWYDTIVHELIHISTIDYRSRVKGMLTFIEEKYRSEIDRDSTDYYESMIDKLTRIIVSLYPETNFIKDDVQWLNSKQIKELN